jgi:hypothetical protein
MALSRFKRLFVSLGFLLAIGSAALFFLYRAPVLLVTDAPFNALYGKNRILVQQIMVQARLFRRVRQVFIGEDAGADMVSLAVKAAAAEPYCILFPYRYAEAAERYAKQWVSVPVAVLGQHNQKPPDGTIFIQTDMETDLYRAGLCAAVLARTSGTETEETDTQKKISVLQKESLSSTDKQIILDGLKKQDFEQNPQYTMASANYNADRKDAAVLILGQANSFFDQNVRAPVVLFSWVNPAATASSVKIVFDDSLWALAVPAVQAARITGTEGHIPSKIVLVSARIEKSVLRDLKKALREDREERKKAQLEEQVENFIESP